MNDRRARFVAEYAVDLNGAAAAARAGYSPGSAKVTASRLLSDANVRQLLLSNQAETARRLELDKEKVLCGLLEAVDVARAQGDPGAMVRAWAEVARLLGYFAAEKALKVDVNITAKRVFEQMETLSDDALLEIVAGSGQSS